MSSMPVARERCSYYPNQEVNDLVRELSLTQSNAELLISRLKQWDLLDDSIRITSQRMRHCGFSVFSCLKMGYIIAWRRRALVMGISCNPSEWRSFFDSSSRSLKSWLLNNTNKCLSIHLAHSVHMKEEHKNIKVLLSALKLRPLQVGSMVILWWWLFGGASGCFYQVPMLPLSLE